MMYELFAIRYGHHDRSANENFLGGDLHDAPMPLDYYVWVVKSEKNTFIFDTGFDSAVARKRNRQLIRPVGDGLKLVGICPDSVEDVIPHSPSKSLISLS